MTAPTGSQMPLRLSDFEIIRELGRGGMGVVCEALQISLGRRIALKILHAGLGLSPTAIQRFKREAQAAARLHHTNIVPIYAIGEQEGVLYYAMELIEGQSLDRVLTEMKVRRAPGTSGDARAIPVLDLGESSGPQGGPHEGRAPVNAQAPDAPFTRADGREWFDQVAAWMTGVAQGLEHAHAEGVIHRDIKPANLMLSRRGHLCVADFGLARVMEEPGMTQSGEFLGTPAYMSPEQIASRRMKVDHRTDIYSLGATLYESLTLRRPFEGQSRDQLVAQIMTRDPKPPRKIDPRIPVDLETICLKAMEKNPDQRYQTAGEMAADLQRFTNRFAISARRLGPLGRLVKWSRRRPAVAGLTAGVIVVAAVAGLFAYLREQERRARIADQGQHALDQALLEALGGRYEEVEPWLEKAEVCDVDPGRILLLRGWTAVERRDFKTAVRQLDLAVQRLSESMGAQALLLRASVESGQFEKAYELFPRIQAMMPASDEDRLYGAMAIRPWWPERAIELLEPLARKRPSAAVQCFLGLSRNGELLSSYNPEHIESTLSDISSAKTLMPSNVRVLLFHFWAYLTAADVYRVHGQLERHQGAIREAKKDAEQGLRDHRQSGDAYSMAMYVAEYEQRWDDALNHLRDAVGRPHSFPSIRFFLPKLLYRLGRYEEALQDLEGMPDNFRASHVWVRGHAFIATELEWNRRGRTDEAIESYLHWLTQHASPVTGRHLGFEIGCFLGRPAEAREMARRRLEELPPRFRPESAFDREVDRFVTGDSSAAALLASAERRAERMYAHYLVGLERLAGGDRSAASAHFDEVVRAGNYVFADPEPVTDNRWAHLLLDRLQRDPTWPPWIPPAPAAPEGATVQSRRTEQRQVSDHKLPPQPPP